MDMKNSIILANSKGNSIESEELDCRDKKLELYYVLIIEDKNYELSYCKASIEFNQKDSVLFK